MPDKFYVTAKAKPDYFTDNVSKGDAVTYDFDFTPWQEDNHTITSVTWTVEAGNASVSGQNLTAGVASALISFPDSGRTLISVLAQTATEKKKIWLTAVAKDLTGGPTDYGFNHG